MANSKPVIAIITASGNNCIIKKIPPIDNIFHAKVARIFNRVCPAIIFAKRRTDKATTLKTYDISSIGTSRGARAKGAPGGKKRLKK